MRLHEAGLRRRRQALGARWNRATTCAAVFGDFAREAMPYFAHGVREHHFIPQCELLLPDFITYTKFFPVERFAEFEDTLFGHLRAQGYEGRLGFGERQPFALSRLAFLLRRKDRTRSGAVPMNADFENFGYDPGSPWRLPEKAPAADHHHGRRRLLAQKRSSSATR